MIKTLQKRFILSAMLAITILLFVLLGAINIGNICMSEKQNKQLIDALIEEKTIMPLPPNNDRPKGFLNGPMDENSRMAAVYFTVKVSERQNLLEINTERIADVSEEEAKEIYQAAIKKDGREGIIQKFRYRAFQNERDGSTTYLFLDTTMQLHSILRVLFFSLIAGAACWLVMLLLVILISKKAIQPIAENMLRQKQFVTDAGHEIKTPLAIILANTEALELYKGETKWSRNIREQTARLADLMQHLLTLAKADESQGAAPREPVSLSSEVTDTLQMFAEPIKLRGLTIDKHIDTDISVRADKEQLLRLISILLDNATKYAPQNSRIHLSLSRHGKNAILRISNACEKLPECPPEKLFDRFYRADAARTQKNGGYGIGLSAAKAIVESHGGTIQAAYTPPNEITFTVTFSLS
ncbi:MAG: GHKL domain-containing protein [Clostridiales bacterium]|nr:GHKL domain-containing protein [Clostridiales bacterium]